MTVAGGVKLVGRVDDLLCVLSSLCHPCGTGINLGIDVDACEEEPSGSLVDTAIACVGALLGLRVAEVAEAVEDLALNVVEEVCSAHLDTTLVGDLVLERDVAPTIHEIEVVHGAEESSLGGHGSVFTRVVLEEVVTHGDGEVEAVVEALEHRVVSVPTVVVELWDARVAPAADKLVGCKPLRVDELADIACGAAVEAVDIAVAVRATLSCEGDAGVALVKDRLLCCGGIHIRVDVVDVEVVYARDCGEGHGSGNKRVYCFHRNVFNLLNL